MKYYQLTIVLTVAACLVGETFEAVALGELEQGQEADVSDNQITELEKRKPTLAFDIKPQIAGKKNVEMTVVVPVKKGDVGKAAKRGNFIVNEMLLTFEKSNRASPSSFITIPFINMYRWQKYIIFTHREYLRAEETFNTEFYLEMMKDIRRKAGRVYDVMIPGGMLFDDGVIDQTELKNAVLVKKYFKEATERYMGIKLKIDEINRRIEIANQLEKVIFPDRVTSVMIVNADVKKEMIISVKCHHDANAVDNKCLLTPDYDSKEFASRYNIPLTGDLATYTTTIATTFYKCESSKIGGAFTLYRLEYNFQKKKIVKVQGNEKFLDDGKPIKFSWFQTYNGNKRVEILDQFRLKIKLVDDIFKDYY